MSDLFLIASTVLANGNLEQSKAPTLISSNLSEITPRQEKLRSHPTTPALQKPAQPEKNPPTTEFSQSQLRSRPTIPALQKPVRPEKNPPTTEFLQPKPRSPQMAQSKSHPHEISRFLQTPVQPEKNPPSTEFSQSKSRSSQISRSSQKAVLAKLEQAAELALLNLPAPHSGAQLYYQRIAALRAGRLYTRLSPDSFQKFWLNATGQQTYEQWRNLLAQEARAVAQGQGDNQLSVILGDSLSLWFPSNRLPTQQFWLNQAISGETTSGVLNRLSDFSKTRPRTIYVMAGINDLKHGATDREVLDNLEQIVRRLQQLHPQAQIVLQSILPTCSGNFSNEQIGRINQQMDEMAHRYGAAYLDLHPYFADSSGQLRQELTTDGLHLNPLGYRAWQLALQTAEIQIARRM